MQTYAGKELFIQEGTALQSHFSKIITVHHIISVNHSSRLLLINYLITGTVIFMMFRMNYDKPVYLSQQAILIISLVFGDMLPALGPILLKLIGVGFFFFLVVLDVFLEESASAETIIRQHRQVHRG